MKSFKQIYQSIVFRINYYLMPDKIVLNKKFREVFGRDINWKNPVTFNEKLQWLKVYNRNPEYTKLVDKYEVRKYIANKIGEEHLIPILGVWDKFEDIDFETLPNQFVLKCTHDSKSVIICENKQTFDESAAKEFLNKHLHMNFYYTGREWPYKNVKPRIIAEKLMKDEKKGEELTDYKFFCTDGRVDNVMVCLGRKSGNTKFYFFDKNWELLRLNIQGKKAPKDFSCPKPECMDKMFELASKLSEGFPFVRVDLYACTGKIYFGELTFYPQNGFDANLLEETDQYFGSLIDLEKVKNS